MISKFEIPNLTSIALVMNKVSRIITCFLRAWRVPYGVEFTGGALSLSRWGRNVLSVLSSQKQNEITMPLTVAKCLHCHFLPCLHYHDHNIIDIDVVGPILLKPLQSIVVIKVTILIFRWRKYDFGIHELKSSHGIFLVARKMTLTFSWSSIGEAMCLGAPSMRRATSCQEPPWFFQIYEAN